ncbi:unnamed protein product [Musa acuminata subsp. malaccensis]|uniref:(wild Malaysian banana) hypothetical protein n=1 Tax=Musa acuminata subsp. malaccensis TaxID=214687 RepID=A0A804JI74_MUSAM|nr:PREDICTED: uncharacterized protein LOC103988477 [Musa acuminata subsp. malaccensis]CAG1846793.1 unnamed protein product [Musa acuminata subsp. malaccensis]
MRNRGRWSGSSCEDGGHHGSVGEILVRVGGGRAISDSGTGSNDIGGEFHSKRIWNTFLVALCAAYCVSFTFTNSYRAASGRLYYAVATLRGIWAFNGRRKGPPEPGTYRLTWSDLFHASLSLSLVAFLTIALLHDDVMRCYHIDLPRKVTNTGPLVIGFLFSVLFVVFPSRRRGTGYRFLPQGDAVYLRS